MMRSERHIVVMMLAAMILLAACGKEPRGVAEPQNSVYYWRTTLLLDSAEHDFMARYHVGKAYVRYFDVVVRDSTVMPNATLTPVDTFPAGVEVIPTVFVMENCLRHDMSGIAERIVRRVLQISATHDIAGVRQLQVDCDWTLRSMKTFYAFLQEVRDEAHRQGMTLSVTVRLHQLSMPAPPADEGVLMVYNTGDVHERNGRNPILDYRDVQPYLKYLHDYDLPLCAAYPVFGWNLLYAGTQFKAIVYDPQLADTSLYRRVDDANYVVRGHSTISEPNSDLSASVHLHPGDSLHVVRPTAAEVLRVVAAMEKARPGINRQTVIYHLDNNHLKTYNNDFYETLYNH